MDSDNRIGTLQAIAYDYNNNTNITCRASTDHPLAVSYSDTVDLLIQGSECLFDKLISPSLYRYSS